MLSFSSHLGKFICVLLGVVFCLSACVSVSEQPLILDQCANNHPKVIQNQANLWLGCWEGRVYVYPVYHPLSFGTAAQYLSRLDPGKLSKISKLSIPGETSSDVTTIAGQIGSELYYFSSVDHRSSLYKMELSSGKTELIWQGQKSISDHDIHIEDSKLWLRLFQEGIQGDYLLVNEGTARIVNDLLRPYSLGEKEFVLDYEGGCDPCLLFREKDGDWQDTGLNCGSKCSLIQTPCGLIVHNQEYAKGGEQTLYLIRPSGEIAELLSFPCLYSDSAINIFGGKLFFSVKRFKEYGEIGIKRFENDEIVNGTEDGSLSHPSTPYFASSLLR